MKTALKILTDCTHITGSFAHVRVSKNQEMVCCKACLEHYVDARKAMIGTVVIR